MKFLQISFFTIFCTVSFFAQAQNDSAFIRKIYDEALLRGESYENLRYLCKEIGHRITGSAEAEMAVKWGEKLLNSYGFDRVYLQEITVPHWERGTTEAAWIENENGAFFKLDILALGGSVGTNGILEADVVLYPDFETFKNADAAEVKGKVVYLGEAFNAADIRTFDSYGHCGVQRWSGPKVAQQKGAAALVIRSLGSEIDEHPHTGSFGYDDNFEKIPAAAISTAHSNKLEQWAKNGKLTLKMEMDCRWYADKKSYNVIGEITGKSEEIITFGGHLDSWDVGEGAHDDGAGIMHCIEALRILKVLDYKPNYTLRCVLFMNEENGNFGGKQYAQLAKEKGEKHIAALESDRGGFLPLGFDVRGTKSQVEFVQNIAVPLQKDFHLYKFQEGYSGVDIGPLREFYPEMIQLGLKINSQEYFNYHHTAADVFETVNQRELELGCAAMASMIYLLDQSLIKLKV